MRRDDLIAGALRRADQYLAKCKDDESLPRLAFTRVLVQWSISLIEEGFPPDAVCDVPEVPDR